jgi:hypothetical protein
LSVRPTPPLNAEPFRARCRAKRGGGVVLRREAQAAIAREVRALLALRVRASPPVKDGPTVDGDQPPERGVGLYRRITTAPIRTLAMIVQRIGVLRVPVHARKPVEIAPPLAMKPTVAARAAGVKGRVPSMICIEGAKSRLRRSFCSSTGQLRAKHHAAMITKIVVGSPGRIAPMMPSAVASTPIPAIVQRRRSLGIQPVVATQAVVSGRGIVRCTTGHRGAEESAPWSEVDDEDRGSARFTGERNGREKPAW